MLSLFALQVATEAELISRSEAFEQAMKENALAQFCDYKVSATEGEDQETWLYLRILFEADPKRYGTMATVTGALLVDSIQHLAEQQVMPPFFYLFSSSTSQCFIFSDVLRNLRGAGLDSGTARQAPWQAIAQGFRIR